MITFAKEHNVGTRILERCIIQFKNMTNEEKKSSFHFF